MGRLTRRRFEQGVLRAFNHKLGTVGLTEDLRIGWLTVSVAPGYTLYCYVDRMEYDTPYGVCAIQYSTPKDLQLAHIQSVTKRLRVDTERITKCISVIRSWLGTRNVWCLLQYDGLLAAVCVRYRRDSDFVRVELMPHSLNVCGNIPPSMRIHLANMLEGI